MTVRGGILLEAMIALALFVGAALAILRATSQAASAVEKASTLQHAVDIATTRLAELETGIVSLADLRAGLDESRPEFGAFDASAPSERLRVEARTERSIFAGLTLLELSVVDSEQVASDGGARSIFTIRKLVRLREEEVDAYEQDDLLENLPIEMESIDKSEELLP
jgi:hypothetical protein